MGHPPDDEVPIEVAFLSIRAQAGLYCDKEVAVPASVNAGNARPDPVVDPPAVADGVYLFAHTAHLLSALVRGILADPKQYIVGTVAAVFSRVCEDFRWSAPSHRAQIEPLIETAVLQVLSFLEQVDGIRICISSDTMQQTGAVLWGVTNREEKRKDTLGLFIPVLNWDLCSCYEDTFQDEFPNQRTTKRRAQLGCIIAIVFMHELNHTLICWKLNDMFNDAKLIIPDIVLGRPASPGWDFETRILRGTIQVSWRAVDSEVARFTTIEGVWLQRSYFVDTIEPLRVIPRYTRTSWTPLSHATTSSSVFPTTLSQSCPTPRSRATGGCW
ncbi:hypothetical protein C8R47DRAFT_1102021 [Mycena vitilis]|nr:hypothetical protein C8R47DRAFT_1102021 [Mycena vitilis]